MGALVNLQSGTYRSYWSCGLASGTPSSTKVADIWEQAVNLGAHNGNQWLYAKDSTDVPLINAGGGFDINPGNASDSLLAFTAPAAGTISIAGEAALSTGTNATGGVLFRIWNGGTIIYPTSGAGWATNLQNQCNLVSITAD